MPASRAYDSPMRLGELGTPALLIGEEEHRPYNRVLLAEVLGLLGTPPR